MVVLAGQVRQTEEEKLRLVAKKEEHVALTAILVPSVKYLELLTALSAAGALITVVLAAVEGMAARKIKLTEKLVPWGASACRLFVLTVIVVTAPVPAALAKLADSIRPEE